MTCADFRVFCSRPLGTGTASEFVAARDHREICVECQRFSAARVVSEKAGFSKEAVAQADLQATIQRLAWELRAAEDPEL